VGTVPTLLLVVVVGDELPPPQALSTVTRSRSKKKPRWNFIDKASPYKRYLEWTSSVGVVRKMPGLSAHGKYRFRGMDYPR
jgi:hypothetical protein